MGTTKWNKRENMENMNVKKREPFKQKKKIKKRGFTKLPTITDVHEGFINKPLVEGNENMETTPELTTEEVIDAALDSGAETYNANAQTAAQNLSISLMNTLATANDWNTLADRQFNAKYEEANLGAELERLFTLDAWNPKSIINNENNGGKNCAIGHSDNGEETFGEEGVEETATDVNDIKKKLKSKASKGTRDAIKIIKQYIINLFTLFSALPKLIILRLDFANYSIKKIVTLFCQMVNDGVENIQEDHLQTIFDQVDHIIYAFMVFVISYNWFFVWFFYEKQDIGEVKRFYQYQYSSKADPINDSIKEIMKNAGFNIKTFFSSVLFVVSSVISFFFDHTGFSLPNILQKIVSFGGLTDIFNSFPCKFLFTLMLMYTFLDPSIKILKTMTGFSVPMGPMTIIFASIVFGAISIIGLLGIFEMFVGPGVYISMFDIMNPTEAEKEEDSKGGTEDDMRKTLEALGDKLGEAADRANDGWINRLISYGVILFTFIIRCMSFFMFLPYGTIVIFLVLVIASLFPTVLFSNGKSLDEIMNSINTAINKSSEPCMTWKSILAKYCGMFNKISFYLVMISLLATSYAVYGANILSNTSLLAGLSTMTGILLLFFGGALFYPDTASEYLRGFLLVFNLFF
jgi:hypothetical protein